ncbi:hypothetical protein MARA_60820 [Mycolicibacterium arabiense]|uniref:Uncharacterized protein n=1 Tax=Mycolicibacterium arabiense TaxID=1286181 RepID=A0A7I7S6V6_9MYCO|nr:hypothetical protein MARA_60820 [Mycolicibacterium arabiense]
MRGSVQAAVNIARTSRPKDSAAPVIATVMIRKVMTPTCGAGAMATASTQAAVRTAISVHARRVGWKARMYIARNIGAIRQTYSAVMVTWNAITIGVAAIAAHVAGVNRSGLTTSWSSPRTPTAMAMMPPTGLPYSRSVRTGNRVKTTP